MGYDTTFNGYLEFNKPVEDWLVDYINKFSATRRMKRSNAKIMELFHDWESQCFNERLGMEGEYFVGGTGAFGQDRDDSVLDCNRPACTQPGLWCQWVIEDGVLVWDGGEKFYEYVAWLEYLIVNFFAPTGYVLNGNIEFQGEDYDDFGVIEVIDNNVNVKYGKRIYSLDDIKTDDLIEELRRRGLEAV